MKEVLPSCFGSCRESRKNSVTLSGPESCSMETGPCYLAEGPQGFLKSCDLLLKLDDGSELPAHSQILARCMPVFAGMVDGGPLSSASAVNVLTVPFSECSLVEARRFLAAIYSCNPHKHIDDVSALSIARLSHKYGVQVQSPHNGLPLITRHSLPLCCRTIVSHLQHILQGILRLCDDILATTAGINSDPGKFPKYLEVHSSLMPSWCSGLSC